MRMLGTDVHTQEEFDKFKAEEFDPVKAEVQGGAARLGALEARVKRLERLCLAFAGAATIAIIVSLVL